MQNPHPKEKLWMSVPTRKGGKFGSRSRKTDAAFREVKDVKRRLDFNDNEDLRSEYHSKLTALRELVSPRKSVHFASKSGHVRSNPDGEKLICWSSSTKEFNDLRHNDYFSASTDDLSARRNTEVKKRERNYCVVNLSDDPSDFCVVRVDEEGVNQQRKQIQKYGFGKNYSPDVHPGLFPLGSILRSEQNQPVQYDEYSDYPTRHSPDTNLEGADSVEDSDVMLILLQRLQNKSREKRLRKQVDDIKNTLKERVLDDSSVSADSYSSHVSVDQAVKTLEILSDALKKTEDEDTTFIVDGTKDRRCLRHGDGDEDFVIRSQRSTGGNSVKDSIGDSLEQRSSNKKLSSSLLSNSSSSRHVQTNVPLLDRVSGTGSRKTESDSNSESSRGKCQCFARDIDRGSKSQDRNGMLKDDRLVGDVNGQRFSGSSGSSSRGSVRKQLDLFEDTPCHCERGGDLDEETSLRRSRGPNGGSGKKLIDRHRNELNGDSKSSLSRDRKCTCHPERFINDGYRKSRSQGSRRQTYETGVCDDLELDLERLTERPHEKRSDFALETKHVDGSPESDDGPLLLSELDSDAGSEEIRPIQNGTNTKSRNQSNSGRNIQKVKTQNMSSRQDFMSHHNQKHTYTDYTQESPDQRRKSRKQNLTRRSDEKHFQYGSTTRNDGSNLQRNGAGHESNGTALDLALTLADVKQLHKEVDVRLQEGTSGYSSGGGGERDLREVSSRQTKSLKRNSRNSEKKLGSVSSTKENKILTNNPANTYGKSSSPYKQKGVLIPGRKSGSVVSRSRSLEKQNSGRPASKNGVAEQTADQVHRHGGRSQGRDSIQMSANITIPDLFGMQITKTIQRPNGEGSPERLGNEIPERRRLNLSFDESVDGEIKNVQCEVQGFDLDSVRRDQEGQGSRRNETSKSIQFEKGERNGVQNNRNKMADRHNETDVNYDQQYQDGVPSKWKPDSLKGSKGLNNNSLKDRFFSSCVDKLEKDSGRHIEDYDEMGRRRNSIGPASVFEPPERDTSTPRKKFEPYHGHPVLSGSQTNFLNSNSSSAADTIMAQLHNPETLRLLKNLYQADDNRRHDLIILTQHFKTWQANARWQKKHREDHDLFMRKANGFLVTSLRKRYFYTWYELARDHRQDRIASALFRHHMLKKGLDAFRWSISRSLHRQDMMKVRVQSIQLSATFNKWRVRAETRRRHRLQNAIKTWRDFTLEAQRARTLRKSLDHKLLQSMLGKWQEMYQLRVKQHKADYYRRHTLLSHMWLSWNDFTALSIQKRSRQQRALAMYREHLQRRILDEMRRMHEKHQRAKKHFRIRTLTQIFQGWHQSSQICKVERQHAMSRSLEHWHAITLKNIFLYWRDTLWNLRAERMAKKTISSHTFKLWKEKWQMNTERRQRIEKQIEMNKLRRSVMLWRENVVLQKRRQAAAIYSLENVLLRQMLGDWRWYTGIRVDMRQRMREHIRYYNSLKLSDCFRVWRKEFEKRVDDQTAQKFWSDRCARKASNKWRLICRKRRLKNTLMESEPLRQLTLQHVMFMRWLEAKQKIDREKTEAANMRTLLQRCQLQRRFQTWKSATKLAMKIKPVQEKRNHQLVIQCFDGWHQLAVHKRDCRQSRDKFLKSCLQKAVSRWRRQYTIHQIERNIKHRMMKGLALVCLHEWNFVIRRKHAAEQFHDTYLVRDMFYHWRRRSLRQIQHKALAKAEKERKENLKSYYFALWWSNVQDQMSETEEAIVMLQQRQAHNRIRRSFIWWRMYLRHTYSGRAYYRILCQRSMRTVLVEWHLTTDNSLSDAVQNFREELGLPVPDEESVDERETRQWNISEGSVASSSGFHSNKERTLWPDFEDNIDGGSTSPRSSTSVGLAFRRMLSGDSYSGQGSDQGDDGQSLSGVSLSQLTVMEQRAQKRERIKNLVITAVTRLRLWPVSVVFDQWLEFTARQRELKLLAAQLCDLHHRTQLTVFLHDWKTAHADLVKATTHFNKILAGKAVRALVEYRLRRTEKKKLSALASRYNQLIVYKEFFPVWLAKTQDRQHQHHILHLWSTTTQEEQELLPLELKLQQQFSRRTLRLCYAVWSLKFQFASKIKHAYHSGLLKRTLSSWHDWSELCQTRRVKCETFRVHRVQSMVFKMWQKRLEQKRESCRRYTATWQSYLHIVLVKWQQWAKVTHHQRLTAIEFIKKREQSVLRHRLKYWQSLTVKTQEIQQSRDTQLTKRVFSGWQDYVMERKRTRQKILQFQVRCYTNLVKHLFGRWRHQYMCRLRQKAEHEALVQMSAVQMGRVWRRKARASRGRRLHEQFQQNKVRCYFSKWKNAYQLCLEREEVLERYLVEKSQDHLRMSLETWRTKRLADQAGRVYNMKLQLAVIEEWRIWTKGSRERRIRGLALQKALQERLLTVYYRFWCEMTRVRRMVQSHSHLKLQLRILQAWRTHTQRQRNLRQLHTFLTNKVNHRIVQSAFVTMRCRFDYCQGLTDMATSLQEDREQRTMKVAIRTWQARLDRIMAARCYGKFLVVRTVRQWRRYVQQRRDERRMEEEKMDLATKHYEKKLCKLVMRGLSNEVCVKHQQTRRKERLAAKYGVEWKRQTDMAYTAAILEREHLYGKMWTRWRLAFSCHMAVNHVSSFEKRHLMSQVFSAWRKLATMKPVKQKSSIPIATSSFLVNSTSPTGTISPPARSSPSQIPSLQTRQFYTNRK